MTTLFISDLHLDPHRPASSEAFIRFCETDALNAEALYILGDFVEYWMGDDDPAEALQPALMALRKVSDHGVPVYLMHGNRDFLIGQQFAEQYHLSLLKDPTVIDLYGTPTLLMHGDTLCIDDVKYQEFRKMVRAPEWQAEFLNKPLSERHAIVNQLRDMSKKETSGKAEDIMDVNQAEVERIMQQHKVQQLIHGHTHRQNTHTFMLNEEPAKRIVLGDWYQGKSILFTAHGQYQFQN